MKKLRVLLLCSLLIIVFIRVYIGVESNYSNGEINIDGVIKSYKVNGDLLSITFNNNEDLIGFYKINSEDEKEYILSTYKEGLIVSIEGVIEEPSVESIPNTFNYREYLYSIGILKVVDISSIKIIKEENIFYKFRNSLYLNDDSISSRYINALLFSDKSYIDNDVMDSYNTNGISHLIAISGMHLGILIGVLNYLLKKFKYRRIIIYIFLISYIFITNFSPSILRASLFMILLDVLKIYKLKKEYILVIVGCILLIIYPYLFYNLGFRYSFISCYFIVRLSNSDSSYLKGLFKVSLIAFIASVPITINISYGFNLLSIIYNLVFVPFVSIIIYPLSLISYVVPIFRGLLDMFLYLLEWSSLLLSRIDIFIIRVPLISSYILIIYYLILNCKYKYKYIYLFLILVIIKIYPYLDSNGYIYYLDVGQGDSTLVVYPYMSEVVLIDTGGRVSYEVDDWKVRDSSVRLGDNIITFLYSIGINEVDNLVLTHGDMDHLGEAKYIYDNFNISNVLINKGEVNKYESVFNVGEFDSELKILDTSLYDNENDNSIVSLASIYGYEFLMMGDVSVKVEDELMNRYELNNIDILKLGHHGSNTSSSYKFLEYIKPEYSIISAGLDNKFGHPSIEVVNRLNMLGINKYITYDVNTIKVVIKENGYFIKV